MPKTPEELIEKNERRARAKEKDAERKEESRLYNLKMKIQGQLIRKEEARQRGLEYGRQYRLKKKEEKEREKENETPPIFHQIFGGFDPVQEVSI